MLTDIRKLIAQCAGSSPCAGRLGKVLVFVIGSVVFYIAVAVLAPHAILHKSINDTVLSCKLISLFLASIATLAVASAEKQPKVKLANQVISALIFFCWFILLIKIIVAESNFHEWLDDAFEFLIDRQLGLTLLPFVAFFILDITVAFGGLSVTQGEKSRVWYYILFVDAVCLLPLGAIFALSWVLPWSVSRSEFSRPILQDDLDIFVNGSVLFLLFAHSIAAIIVSGVVEELREREEREANAAASL